MEPCAAPPAPGPTSVPPDLDSLHGDSNAMVCDFIGAYAADLPPEESAICISIGDDFIRKHLRTRLGQLFRLTHGTATNVVRARTMDEADAPGWIQSFEDAAGFEFRDRSVPKSADLAYAAGETGECKGTSSTGTRKFGAPNTVGMSLAKKQKTGGSGEWTIPEVCYRNAIFTLDPTHNEISEPELEQFTTELVEAAGTCFGRYNLGMPLCRKLGRAVAKRLPKMPKGKAAANRADPNVGWKNAILNKTRNRKYVCASATPLPPHATHTRMPSFTESVQPTPSVQWK